MRYKFKNENYFEKITNEYSAYFLGLIMADGSINKKLNTLQLTLIEDDKNLLKKLINEIYENRKLRKIHIYNKKNPNWKIQYQLTVTSRFFIDCLNQYGIIQNKSVNLVNFNFSLIPKKYIKDFIRGYFDGDGCFYWNKKTNNGHVTFTGQTNFIKDLKILLKKEIPGLGKLPIYNRHKNSKHNSTIQIGGNVQVNLIYNYLYQNSNIFSERKYNKYCSFIQQCILKNPVNSEEA